MFFKSVIKNPTCFGPYSMAISNGRPFYLLHLPSFGCLLPHLSLWYVTVCRLCVCVSDVPVCGLSGRQLFRCHYISMHFIVIRPK
jgi:hypothetical protein